MAVVDFDYSFLSLVFFLCLHASFCVCKWTVFLDLPNVPIEVLDIVLLQNIQANCFVEVKIVLLRITWAILQKMSSVKLGRPLAVGSWLLAETVVVVVTVTTSTLVLFIPFTTFLVAVVFLFWVIIIPTVVSILSSLLHVDNSLAHASIHLFSHFLTCHLGPFILAIIAYLIKSLAVSFIESQKE